jgi:hypothetical protein
LSGMVQQWLKQKSVDAVLCLPQLALEHCQSVDSNNPLTAARLVIAFLKSLDIIS